MSADLSLSHDAANLRRWLHRIDEVAAIKDAPPRLAAARDMALAALRGVPAPDRAVIVAEDRAKLGPHRTAIEAALAMMQLRYGQMPPAILMEDVHSRALTLALTEVTVRSMANMQDAGGNMELWAHGFTHAVANVIASVCSCLTGHQQPAMSNTAEVIGAVILERALLTAAQPSGALFRVGAEGDR